MIAGGSSHEAAGTPGLHAWMEAYVDGDESAFRHLHAWLEPRIQSFLRKMISDEEVRNDLVQLTLLKAHLARHRFTLPTPSGSRRPTRSEADRAVAGWYFAIARNVAMDELRSRYRGERQGSRATDGEISLEQLADPRPDVEEMSAAHESERAIIDAVSAAIAQLPVTQREVIELHKLRGMTMAEVADRLHVREGAVRVRAHRGYRALARLLHKQGISGAAWTLAVVGVALISTRRILS